MCSQIGNIVNNIYSYHNYQNRDGFMLVIYNIMRQKLSFMRISVLQGALNRLYLVSMPTIMPKELVLHSLNIQRMNKHVML